MDKKRRLIEWNVISLVGVIFAAIGLIFTVLGVIFGLNIEAIKNSPNSSGDVEILPWVFGGMGILFLILGVLLLAIQIRNGVKRNRLMDEGYYVWAQIMQINPDGAQTINGRHPNFFECHYQDERDGRLIIFKSRSFMAYPAELIGKTIKVYVERGNYDNYYVDVDSVISGLKSI